MNIRLIALSAVASSVLTAATPMVSTSMSTDNGGTKSAIDAYSDGGGVVIINQAGDTKFDNSAMNGLVFKYGQVAKTSNTTLKNQVSVLSADTTAAEKAISVKFDLAKVVINPPVNGTSCDDANPQTVTDIWTNGLCGGNNIENQSCNDNDIQTINDKYHNGVCGGTNVEGVACDDTIAQTITDVYHNGICAGVNVEGQTCNDNVAQTINDKYTAGVCAGTNVEGQACNDNLWQTVVDKYTNGVCSGRNPLSCKELSNSTPSLSNGIYNIWAPSVKPVYCDMGNGGWTLIDTFASSDAEVGSLTNALNGVNISNSAEAVAAGYTVYADIFNEATTYDYTRRVGYMSFFVGGPINGYLQKTLPSFGSQVKISFGNFFINAPATVSLSIGSTVVKVQTSNIGEYTYTGNYAQGDALKIIEENVGIASIGSLWVK